MDPSAGDDVLRDELAKWRERVPKLAAALRQRAEENAALKEELERLRSLQSAGPGTAAGIRARDELIAELEGKLADLAERHKVAQGELHKRKLEVDELKGDVEAWKGKWQSVTRALDTQAAEETDREQQYTELQDTHAALSRRVRDAESALEARARALDEVTEERDSLLRRNEQLFETTELANRQIGSLTDSLTELRVQLRQHREQEALLTARLKAASTTGEEAESAVVRLTEELHLMSAAAASSRQAGALAQTRVATAERARQEAEYGLAEAQRTHAELQSVVEEQRHEVGRLTEVVETARRTISEREQERRELSERLRAMDSRNAHLEEQLAERSALVLTLEQDLAAATTAREALERERDELDAARMRAERHVKESAEHIRELDAKLQRQQELMQNLESELAEARADQACPHAERDDKLMLVLKAQLTDARARNDELLARVRKLEAELAEESTGGSLSGDDLTRIHGVGHKLAEQLNDLGIRHYRQIAELSENELADENHVLHGHRGRIMRDGWIEQAGRLISH